MKAFAISGQTGESRILVGESLDRAASHLPPGRVVAVTDENVYRLYGARFPVCETIVLGTGEKVKTLDTVHEVYTRLLSAGADRGTFLLGIGGGIVCDITGFAAATWMRGVRFGFVATTLLAQVDASVGGKNGVNFSGYKNIVGTFAQPSLVICAPEVLGTLPGREVACGLAEIVKHALIASADMFAFLEAHAEDALALVPEVVSRLVAESVEIKAGVVARDERESGERKKLNFGHTWGHALEKVAGVSHGEAVAAGMVVAARLSRARGLVTDAEVARLERLLTRLSLPLGVPVDEAAALDAMARDKKRRGDAVDFVLLDGIGRARVEPVPLSELSTLCEAGRAG